MGYKFLFVALVFSSVGCSPTLSFFTQQLYDDNRWTDADLKQIQFYLSQDLTLRRKIQAGSSEIINGKIKMEKGQQVEIVTISKGTPGVFLFSPKENRFAVSFEDGTDKRYLIFGPNPKVSNRYVLLATDWNKKEGKVQYDGKFYTVDADFAYSGLMVDLKNIKKVSVNTRTAKGRKING